MARFSPGGGVARVPEELIGRLKAEVSLVSLAASAGVALRKTGADFTGCCPFHEDDTPSLVISPERNLWHCLGACQAGWSVIDWVMRAEGVSFRHAVELLRDGMPAVSAAAQAPGRSTVRKLAWPVERGALDHELLGQVVSYYHRVLTESPDTLGYLARRKISHPEAVETFRLGCADRSLGLRLPDKRRKDGAEIRGRLEQLGIFRASGHEHFAGSLVIPVTDEHGNVTEVYGRKTGDRLRAGSTRTERQHAEASAGQEVRMSTPSRRHTREAPERGLLVFPLRNNASKAVCYRVSTVSTA
jgi:DNA primase